MATELAELDVRPILRAGGEPFGEIMGAIARLGPGQGLRLLATFKPAPLFAVLGRQGFAHEAREIGGGDWEVVFTPAAASASPAAAPAPVSAPAPAPAQQPGPVMDLRDLDPPEPMVRILAAIEGGAPGSTIVALLQREPAFLIPELDRRGHRWEGAFEGDGTAYRIEIRLGAG
ncbi:MAG: DUF2249 domain-containing protein [Rubellimicrobium sp.]|nr:DUF2249 domain-containing protein [Rubellimicrobium sp.]